MKTNKKEQKIKDKNRIKKEKQKKREKTKREKRKEKKKKREKAKNCYMTPNKITQAQHFLSGTSFANIL